MDIPRARRLANDFQTQLDTVFQKKGKRRIEHKEDLIDRLENLIQYIIDEAQHQERVHENRIDTVRENLLRAHCDIADFKNEVIALNEQKDEVLTQLNDAQQRVQTLEQLVQDLKETVAEYDDQEYRAEAFDEEFDDNDKMQGPSAEIMDAALKTKNGC
jgi:chromosome segregation ATPase